MLPPEIYNALNKWAARVVAQARANLTRKRKNATKDLWKSIAYKVNPKTGDIEFSYADYGTFVESGRRAGAKLPPPNKLAKWAKIKGLPRWENEDTGEKYTYKQMGWMIAVAIQRDGIQPYPFFTSALNRAMNDYYYKLEEAVAQAITHDMEALNEMRGGQ